MTLRAGKKSRALSRSEKMEGDVTVSEGLSRGGADESVEGCIGQDEERTYKEQDGEKTVQLWL